MPQLRQPLALLGLFLLVTAFGGASAAATTTIHLGLRDKGDGHMVMTTSTRSVKEGKVTFAVTNRSHDMQHEFLVAPLHTSVAKVPYNGNSGRIRESKMKGLKELGDLNPGKSGRMTMNLRPGKYLLFCNKPGHFKAGMYQVLTVKP